MKSRIVAGNRPKAVVVAIVAIGSVCAGVYTAYEFRRSERGEEVLNPKAADEPLRKNTGDANSAPEGAERAEAPPAGTSSPARRADRPRDIQPVEEAARSANADPPQHTQPEQGGRGEEPITAAGPATSRRGPERSVVPWRVRPTPNRASGVQASRRRRRRPQRRRHQRSRRNLPRQRGSRPCRSPTGRYSECVWPDGSAQSSASPAIRFKGC